MTCNPKKGGWEIIFTKPEIFLRSISSYAEINGDRIYTFSPWVENRCETNRGTDNLGPYQSLILHSRCEKLGIEIQTSINCYHQKKGGVLMNARVLNCSASSTIKVGRVGVFFIKSEKCTCLELGGNFNRYRIYIDSGSSLRALVRNLAYDPLVRRYEREMENTSYQDWVEGDNQHRSMGTCAIFNPETSRGLIISFITFEKSRCEIKTEYSEKKVESISGECEFAGYELEPGKKLNSEWLWLCGTQEPIRSLEEYGATVKEYNRLKIKDAPVGWCSWYPKGYRDNISEKKILANARAIKKHLAGFGIKWIQLDYGWFDRNIPGEYKKKNKNFPRGIAWLGRELRKLGFELGLWFCPSVVTEESSFFKKHPEALLHDKKGQPVPRHLSSWTWKPGGRTYDLDPTHPAAKKFLTRTFYRAVHKYRCSYFKNDFLEQVSRIFVEHRDKKIIKGLETYRKLLQIVRNAAGKEAFIYGCSNLSNGSLGLVDSTKTAPDIGVSKKSSYAFKPFGHLRTTFGTIGSRWYQNKLFWINDPDALVFEGSGLEEAKIRATVVEFCGGTFMLGDNMPELVKNKKFLNLYKICLPPYGKAARPIDLFENDHDYPGIWDLPVETTFGKWHVIALFNFDEDNRKICLDFCRLGLDARRKYLVWDFWKQKLLGQHSKKLEIEIQGVSTKLFLIKETPLMPDFLSTNLHLTQGAVEVYGVNWNEGELSGICRRPVGEKGSLFIYVPKNYTVKETWVGGKKVEPILFSGQVVKVPLEFRKKEIPWIIRFAENKRIR